MKKCGLFLLTFSLVFSLAAPAGAVFAQEEVEVELLSPDAYSVAENPIEETDKNVVEQAPVASEATPFAIEVEGEAETVPMPAPEVPIVPGNVAEREDADVPAQVGEAVLASGVVITELQTRGAVGATSELIELFNGSEEDVDITGWCVQRASASGANYTNVACAVPSDGSTATRVVLPAKSYVVLVSEGFISANPEFNYDLKFSSGLADTGGRLRVVGPTGVVVDLLGWGAAAEFLGSQAGPGIPTSQPLRSLQRVLVNGQYQDIRDNYRDFILNVATKSYQPGSLYEVTDMCVNLPGIQAEVADYLFRMKDGLCVDRTSINFCPSIRINEIAANVTRQYIELANDSDTEVSIGGCRIVTNRSSSTAVELPDVVLGPGAHHLVYIQQTPLKLTKSTSGTVYLLASDGETEQDEVFYKDLSVDTSWSRMSDGWKQTYILTPAEDNEYAQYPACEDGYWRNEATGRCNKLATPAVATPCRDDQYRSEETGRCRNLSAARSLVPCREGQYRSEETNRCRSIATLVSSLKPCADDQFRNPETNRCKKIASAEEVALADCGEGRERNPATNRCRNVLSATMPAAPFAPEQIKHTAEATWMWWGLGGISLAALAYAGWQWRFEAQQLMRRVGQAFISRGK